MDNWELVQVDACSAVPRRNDECGRNSPKYVLFRSPLQPVFKSVTDARSSRLRPARCVPLLDLHGVGLPHHEALSSPVPSFSHTDYRPIARLARPLSNLHSSSTDNLSSFNPMLTGIWAKGATRPLETPPTLPDAFETISGAQKDHTTPNL